MSNPETTGTGQPMATAPRDRHIRARGIPVRRSNATAGEYVLGDEMVAEVYYEPPVAIEQGPAITERWSICSPSSWDRMINLKEWWPL